MLKLQLATKKKTIADEAGAILQAKLRQLAPSTKDFLNHCNLVVRFLTFQHCVKVLLIKTALFVMLD